jgi:hypothetical protein
MGSTIVSDSAKARSTKLALTSEGSTIRSRYPRRQRCPLDSSVARSPSVAQRPPPRPLPHRCTGRSGRMRRVGMPGRETASALTKAIAQIDGSRSTMVGADVTVRHRRESDLGRGGAMQQDKLRVGNASLRAKSDPPEDPTMSRAHPLVMSPTGPTAGGAPVGAPEWRRVDPCELPGLATRVRQARLGSVGPRPTVCTGGRWGWE